MIITHTCNAAGQRRVYLGSKSSLECWIEPGDDGGKWSFHLEPSPTCYPPSADHLREWAAHILLGLADELNVSPNDLQAVPFEHIAALHVADPADYRRVAVPRRATLEHAYMSTPPHVTRPGRASTCDDKRFQRRR